MMIKPTRSISLTKTKSKKTPFSVAEQVSMAENRKLFNLGIKFKSSFLNLHFAILMAVIFLVSGFYHFNLGRNSVLFSSGNVNASKNHESSLPLSQCNLFEGKWVKDNESVPLYRGKQCSLMIEELACEQYGRKNLDYQKWRWQPHHCDLPRFDVIDMLERLRNKRVVYVGDSVNRNQWMSMVCLIESSLMDRPKQLRHHGSLITFKAFDYNVSVDFYWEPLLLESNGDDPVIHRVSERIIKNHGIEKHGKNWKDADVLVFNSYVWWRMLKIKLLSGSFESGETRRVYQDIEMMPAYEMALQTWFDWLNGNVNRTRTQVFFVSSSPTHNRAEEWGSPNGHKCFYETEPVTKEGYWTRDSDPRMMHLVETYLNKLSTVGFRAQMINITQLSEYRKDAHPSMYRKFWANLTQEELTTPNYHTDCTHWCLPGVPDVWNHFLYTYLFYS